MNRAAVVYLVSIGICAAGLWAVLELGGGRRAPVDLNGEWSLSAIEPTPNNGAPRRQVTIEQSGRFVRLSFDGGPYENYRLTPAVGHADAAELHGPNGILLVTKDSRTDELQIVWQSTQFPSGHARLLAKRASAELKGTPEKILQRVARGPGQHLILILLIEIAVILALSQVMGRLFVYLQQPKVMGEMVAGIMLGPSLFGWWLPETSHWLFPAEAIGYLNILSQIGVIFFLFLVGLELNPSLLRNRGHAAVVISHVSIIAPFLFGGVLAIYLYPIVFQDSPVMRFSSVALFMGAAMSVTAFPVLARILTERNLHKTPVGAIAITCAAVDDVTAWCLLAFVVGFARAQGLSPALLTAGLSVVYVLLMFVVVRPLLVRMQRVHERQGTLSRGIVGLVFLLVLASAGATEAIGIHALFGAFLMGAIMPKSVRFVRGLNEKIEDFTVIVLLPIFFAYTGLKTHIGLLNTGELWFLTGLIILVACAGKFGGSTLAARACRLGWRESSAIGILMNTRGLMELVILNIGRELGVISNAVFAMMILMALVTTFLTSPVLHWVYPDRLLRRAVEPEPAAEGWFSVLLPISLPRSVPPLLRLADVLTGPDNARRRVIGLHLREAEEHEAYRAADNGSIEELSEPLKTFVDEAQKEGIPAEPLSFVTREPALDIAHVAQERGVQIVLMGFHNPVIGQAVLGGTVHRVLQNAATDVGIFVDRGMHTRPRTILVPYLGSPHDRLALELAARMARHSGAAVTVLHVIPPGRNENGAEGQRLGAESATQRVFADPTQPAPVTFKVVEHSDPISAVLEYAKPFDLVVVGIAEKWGLTSHLFGWHAERIARDCPSPLLIVRKHAAPAL
jgi:Kef-type K+ transport system membrane component KefB/nucleotide-binding universal stress UspA family protein